MSRYGILLEVFNQRRLLKVIGVMVILYFVFSRSGSGDRVGNALLFESDAIVDVSSSNCSEITEKIAEVRKSQQALGRDINAREEELENKESDLAERIRVVEEREKKSSSQSDANALSPLPPVDGAGSDLAERIRAVEQREGKLAEDRRIFNEESRNRQTAGGDSSCSSYAGLFSACRKTFAYECPLQKPVGELSAKSRAIFARQLNLFDFRVDEQIEMWKSFDERGYATADRHQLLKGKGGMYPDLDRTSLFCILRHFKPKRVLEIGSGESTEVAAEALKVNAQENSECVHTAIEPYRFDAVPKTVKVIKEEMQEVDFALFDELEDGDVLFIDSSHVVMPYGDTLTELLFVLPRLSTGVMVHIHDIFLPYDYKRNWLDKDQIYTEQWMVALLLYGASSEWEVIWGSRIMMTEHKDVITSMKNYPTPNPDGGSLWIKKLGPPIRT